jgi:hypothetical protein
MHYNKKPGTTDTEQLPDLKLKQLQYEIDSCKRMLDFMSEENIHMKNRISEILKEKFDTWLLEEVDGFQTRFIRKDNLIALLRNEISEMDKLLLHAMYKEGKPDKKIEIKLKRLHRNIDNTEKQSGKLKSDFHRFLSTNIL